MSGPDKSSPHRRAAALVLLALIGAGCATPWRVVQAADPNPLRGTRSFHLTPLLYIDLHIDGKPESRYVEDLGVKAASWAANRAAISERMTTALLEQARARGIDISQVAGSARFTIQPTISSIDSGYYRQPASDSVSRIEAVVRITDASGVLVDEVVFARSEPYDLYNPSFDARLRNAATVIGGNIADYVARRAR